MSPFESFAYPVLSVELLADTGKELGMATAVLFDVGWRRYLVTNFHVVSGCHPFTGKLVTNSPPARLAVHYRRPSQEVYPSLIRIEEDLFDGAGRPRWVEPEDRRVEAEGCKLNLAIDLVALPVEKRTEYPGIDWQGAYSFHLEPGEHVSIVGYPFAISDVGNFPIWLNGMVASGRAGTRERNFFLVDSRTRPSCSGSLVIHRARGASLRKPGGFVDNFGNVSYVMGIYSGRLNEQSDIGFVWQWQLLEALFKAAAPDAQFKIEGR
jgi:hypothetical protein